MKIIKSLEETRLLIQGVSEAIKNETKEQKGWLLGMLLGTLGASLLGNLLTGRGLIRASEGTVRTGENVLMLPHPLTNFEMQKYYEHEPKFNGVYSGNNLSKINNEVYIITLDEYESIGTHWIALYVNDNNVTYLIALGLNIFQKKLKS